MWKTSFYFDHNSTVRLSQNRALPVTESDRTETKSCHHKDVLKRHSFLRCYDCVIVVGRWFFAHAGDVISFLFFCSHRLRFSLLYLWSGHFERIWVIYVYITKLCVWRTRAALLSSFMSPRKLKRNSHSWMNQAWFARTVESRSGIEKKTHFHKSCGCERVTLNVMDMMLSWWAIDDNFVIGKNFWPFWLFWNLHHIFTRRYSQLHWIYVWQLKFLFTNLRTTNDIIDKILTNKPKFGDHFLRLKATKMTCLLCLKWARKVEKRQKGRPGSICFFYIFPIA